MSQRITVLEFTTARIDDKGVIKRVKIVGTDSRNGYVYPVPVLRAARALYEAAPVFVEHPAPEDKGSRKLRDHFGSLANVREGGGNGEPFGLFADLHCKLAHPMAKDILEAATGEAKFGLSHNAIVDMNEDETEVTKIVEINSVDLVDNPATSKNLFESAKVIEAKKDDDIGDDPSEAITGSEMVESIDRHLGLLAEMDEEKPPLFAEKIQELTSLRDVIGGQLAKQTKSEREIAGGSATKELRLRGRAERQAQFQAKKKARDIGKKESVQDPPYIPPVDVAKGVMTRLSALEAIDTELDELHESAAVGDSHEDFIGELRGFRVD